MVAKKADNGKVRVFVYGTLKQGHGNNPLLANANASFLGYDTISGHFQMFDLGGIPALVHNKQDRPSTVKGQIFATTDAGLAALDHLEGHPHFYERIKVWSDMLKRRVWVYFLVAPKFLDSAKNITEEGIWNPTQAEQTYWAKREQRA